MQSNVNYIMSDNCSIEFHVPVFTVIAIWNGTHVYYTFPDEASFRNQLNEYINMNIALTSEKISLMKQYLDKMAEKLINYGNQHAGEATNNQLEMIRSSWGLNYNHLYQNVYLNSILVLVYYNAIDINMRNEFGFEIRKHDSNGTVIYSNRYEEILRI